ncbi:conserved hypothetical protein [Crenothrix polyspora]|uniref:Uncharacterized protein n=1 Tax=Crenothrix polyspora TaxID=360316 RepID=A0A1R4H425_9GAMM|nr:conserved hypothetical protein [Crenothrix polyspora]
MRNLDRGWIYTIDSPRTEKNHPQPSKENLKRYVIFQPVNYKGGKTDNPTNNLKKKVTKLLNNLGEST